MSQTASRARQFIQAQATGLPAEYAFCTGGQVSLYASCYAAMALHYIGDLASLSTDQRAAWCDYINSWQDPETGYYLGPELSPGQLTVLSMDATYVRLHLIVHVLPALEVLGGAPAYPLTFARYFADPDHLIAWLRRRDWRQAWLEGNNLLFAGQLLVYLRDKEGYAPAADALNLYLDWLDEQQDPATGLWGTNGFCGPYEALYGAYHQLLVYHACGRPVHHAERIIDTVLPLQQPDGSFSRTPGGGACEDVDAVDVLVNLVKRTGYREAEVRRALARVIPHILRQQAPDGGFVFRWGHSYMQSGVLRTFTPANQSEIFSTWFRLHTLALINEVVADAALSSVPWGFNISCSMGWHDQSVQIERLPTEVAATPTPTAIRQPPIPVRRRLAAPAYRLLRRLPAGPMLRSFLAVLPRYLRLLPAEQGLAALLEIERFLDPLGRERSHALAGGLDVAYWWSQGGQYYVPQLAGCRRVVHLGCSDGTLSFTLASQTTAEIVATDADSGRLAQARSLFHHPRLTFASPADVPAQTPRPNAIALTDLTGGKPAWEHWEEVWRAWPDTVVLAQMTAFPSHWHEVPAANASGTTTAAPVEQIEGLAPKGWRVLEATSSYGALHARLLTPGLALQPKE